MADGGGLYLTTSREGDRVVIDMRDEGVGISKKDMEHIVDSGFTTNGENGGTGFGLAIVRNIVKKYGGEIGVESKLGEGTTFRLSFPLSQRNFVKPSPELEKLPEQLKMPFIVPPINQPTMALRSDGVAVNERLKADEEVEFKNLIIDLRGTDEKLAKQASRKLIDIFAKGAIDENGMPKLNDDFRKLAGEGEKRTDKTDKILSEAATKLSGTEVRINVTHDGAYNLAQDLAEKYGKGQIVLTVLDWHNDGGKFDLYGKNFIWQKNRERTPPTEGNWIESVMSEDLAKYPFLIMADDTKYPTGGETVEGWDGRIIKMSDFIESYEKFKKGEILPEDIRRRFEELKNGGTLLFSVDFDIVLGDEIDTIRIEKLNVNLEKIEKVKTIFEALGFEIVGLDLTRSLNHTFNDPKGRDYTPPEISDYILAQLLEKLV